MTRAGIAGGGLPAAGAWPAEQPKGADAQGPSAAANQIADFFSKVGDQLYEDDCIFELSPEQIEVQRALIGAYLEQGASSVVASRLAVQQIQPPKQSEKCERLRHQQPHIVAPAPKEAAAPPTKKGAPASAKWAAKTEPEVPAAPINISKKKILPQWDCGPNVDYVTIHLKGFERKLTGGEICNPYEDVVREVPAGTQGFRFGYTIATGRL